MNSHSVGQKEHIIGTWLKSAQMTMSETIAAQQKQLKIKKITQRVAECVSH